jgi:hypothetical protein
METIIAEKLEKPEKLTILQQIKKLDEERAKLLESAKNEALAKATEAVEELKALGFSYELAEPAPGKTRAPRAARGTTRKVIDHTPQGSCPICQYATTPPHDRRSHRSQTEKRPFTNEELKNLDFVRV